MVLTNMAAFFVFVAVAVVYAGHGALNYGQVYAAMAEAPRTAEPGRTRAGGGRLRRPRPGWCRSTDGWPTPTPPPRGGSALFSGLMVNLGLLGIARFVFDVQAPNRGDVLGLLAVVGGFSALVGAAIAPRAGRQVENDCIASTPVSQMGVLMVALSVGSPESLTGMTYHMVNHALFKRAAVRLCGGDRPCHGDDPPVGDGWPGAASSAGHGRVRRRRGRDRGRAAPERLRLAGADPSRARGRPSGGTSRTHPGAGADGRGPGPRDVPGVLPPARRRLRPHRTPWCRHVVASVCSRGLCRLRRAAALVLDHVVRPLQGRSCTAPSMRGRRSRTAAG